VLVGFADGCVPETIDATDGNNCALSRLVSDNGLVDHGAIVRQMSGKGLFAAYDAVATRPVQAPPAAAPPAAPAPAAGGNLAATGGLPAAGVGLLLLLLPVLAARRRRS
jgi:hypothetical protein